MFDWFLNEEAKIAKRQRVLTDKAQPAEERDNAAVWLLDNASPKAVVALLTRFDLTLEHQIHDRNEKDKIYQALVELGADRVSRAVRAHLRRCKQVTWPLQILGEIDGPAAAMDLVLELLDVEAKRTDFKAERKVDLLNWLAERRDPRAVEAAIPLIADFDEGVRCGAAAVILAQGDERGKGALEARLADADEDSNRLKVRIATAYAQRRWRVAAGEAVAPGLPPGFAYKDGYIVGAG